ncbi:Site-specific recombinase XerD [Malonomonas rubra DSM 5091]|uniref:Site-specific recombinase XerD n=1 Tax=Malonomonas rubra DSM 5091 TaxID=1122189 RepID=A0A1M6B1N7_MALRU|nr:site-specific integrase [Malonomonas rubra]SHI42631.1 Site-specific recombinase XerD [Malonomonas rubra DSM 5091]
MALSPAEIQQLVDQFYDSLTEEQHRQMAQGDGTLMPTTAGMHAQRLLENRNDIDPMDIVLLSSELLRAAGYSRRSPGRYGRSNLPSEGRSLADPAHAMGAGVPRPVAESASGGMLLSELCELRIKSMMAQERAPKTISSEKSKHKHFIEILGDRMINAFTLQDFLSFREEMIASGRAEQTVHNTCVSLSTLFNFAVESDCLEKSRVPRWKKSRELKRSTGWDEFGEDNVKALLESPWYSKGKPLDYRGWIPIISLYSGLRIDEVCQLHKSDLLEVDGVLCLSVNDDGNKKVKTDTSIRKVPVHSELVRLGLTQYVDKQDGERMFPALQNNGHGYGSAYGKVFGRYLRKHITKEKKVVFHSIRKSFASKLSEQSVSEELIGALLGHSPENVVTSLYIGERSISVLKGAVDKIPVWK